MMLRDAGIVEVRKTGLEVGWSGRHAEVRAQAAKFMAELH